MPSTLPRIRHHDSDDREICLIVDPLYFAIGPFTATAFCNLTSVWLAKPAAVVAALTLDDGAEF